MRMTRLPRHTFRRALCCAIALAGGYCVVLKMGPPVHAWAIHGRNHHADLAQRAALCLRDVRRLFPRNCRSRLQVNYPYLFDELARGATEPDLLDGKSSSKHSFNPRYTSDDNLPIKAAYGIGIGLQLNPQGIPINIKAGKADLAIEEEEQRLQEDVPAIQNLCTSANDPVAAYGALWWRLGRLSHYLADAHSPFHPNSFGLDPKEKSDDYHEGVREGTAWHKVSGIKVLLGRLHTELANSGWVRPQTSPNWPARCARGRRTCERSLTTQRQRWTHTLPSKRGVLATSGYSMTSRIRSSTAPRIVLGVHLGRLQR